MLTHTSLDTHQALIEAADGIRPLPAGLVELASTLADPTSGVEDLEPIVRNDPALTAFVIRDANSAASASQTEIVDVEAAIVRVGGARLLANAIADTMSDEMNAALPGYGLGPGELWQHSVASSYVAEVVRSTSSAAVGREVVTTAMLHDLGKIVVTKLAPGDALARLVARTGDVTEAERELLDVDHGELGVALARLWKLPEVIVEAIGGHHHPGDSIAAHALVVANNVAHKLVPVGPDRGWPETLVATSLDALGLELDTLLDAAARHLIRSGVVVPDESSALN